ncbi:MAG TPA: DUF4153 domain-containing protein [Caulobacteraceae bacterium]
MAEPQAPPGGATNNVGASRLAVGLVQGLALFALSRASQAKAWPATDGPLFAALLLAAAYAPLIALAGLGHLRRLTLALWTLIAAALAALLAACDVASALPQSGRTTPGFAVAAFTATALFIIHHLIAPIDAERRITAPYARYFDAGWLNAAQLGLAIAFTGVFWILLELGASLFGLIGLQGFRTFIHHDWFHFPALAMAFAAAVHLADVRVNLTRGLRTVGLVLLSWLLPVMAAIAVAFLFALPFTGLAPLWRAGSATGIVLSAMAALIVLINASYQDGEHAPATVLRWAARLTAVILVPLAGLAIWGLGLRIGQHGPTPQRIIAAACALVGACYALGYAWAAVRPGRWMRRLEATNIAAALLIVALILALFTPITDPARLAVAGQLARLSSGRVAPAKFDYALLRFGAGRYGLQALQRLAARNRGAVATFAAAALKQDESCRNGGCAPKPAGPVTIAVYPAGASLPGDFLASVGDDVGVCAGGFRCEAYILALPGETGPEVLLRSNPAFVFLYARAGRGGGWTKLGGYEIGDCPAAFAALRAGAAQAAAPGRRDLQVMGARLAFQPNVSFVCPTPASAAGALSMPATAPSAASPPASGRQGPRPSPPPGRGG